MLHDYVPFYFGERSPMLYAIHHGHVAGASWDQHSMIHLVSSVDAVVAAELGWVFTDGHAVIQITRFFDRKADLGQLDWATIHARSWSDTPRDPDRKRRKQAEFLVHRFLPLPLIHEIVVGADITRQIVARAVATARANFPIHLRHDWYY
jgi:hypothetical protein